MPITSGTARRRLDEKLSAIPIELLAVPTRGWIAAVRQALGMSVRDLGERMGTSGQRASKLEHDELSGRIQLDSLERAAAAMDCRVVYAFIPNDTLEGSVQRQARLKAEESLAPVWHSMRLEDQSVRYSVQEEQIEELAAKLIDHRGLWSRSSK